MKNNVLLLGSGGREDALAWTLSQSPLVAKIWVLPGNPAMKRHSNVTPLSGSLSAENILSVCTLHQPDLIMFGPEQPIVDGIGDLLRSKGFSVCAPSAQAAQLEGSKIFSKSFMDEFGIPTAQSVHAHGYPQALEELSKWDFSDGIVIKSDSLAGGKGVVLCDTLTEAKEVVHQFMVDPNIKVQTEHILFEKKLHGTEVSAFALLDGENFVELGYACDYKRAFDNDQGPNTGGMGTYTPQDWPQKHHKEQIRNIFAQVCSGMKKRGHPYIGILFAGLMVDEENVHVIEFNIRFGDPETQVLMPTLSNDLFPLLQASAQGTLAQYTQPITQEQVAVHVVLASEGYPSIGAHPVRTGCAIHTEESEALVFYAGVREENEVLYSSGGRVMGSTGVGETLEAARTQAYEGLNHISFDGMHHRSDIGLRS
jgi:phosphoribosylamine--glycine ligase